MQPTGTKVSTTPPIDDPKDYLYLAKSSEKAERYADAAEFMTKYVEHGKSLTEEGRAIMQLVFKGKLNDRRSMWRTLNAIESRNEEPAMKVHVQKYRQKTESALKDVCNEVLNLNDKHLLPKAQDAGTKVFCLKMKADYYRYMAEVDKLNDGGNESSNKARQCYEEATRIASQEMHVCDSTRIGLALNLSVFYHEIIQDKELAVRTAREVFEAGREFLDELPYDQYPKYEESLQLLGLISENLAVWDPSDNATDTDAESNDDFNNGENES